jgi:hypothetical protein
MEASAKDFFEEKAPSQDEAFRKNRIWDRIICSRSSYTLRRRIFHSYSSMSHLQQHFSYSSGKRHHNSSRILASKIYP